MNKMNKTKIQLTLKQLNLIPKKSLGQNFLIDKNVAKKIITESELTNDDIVLEIGPGLGALTRLLVNVVNKVYAIEIEPQFCHYLSETFSEYRNLEIINNDILKTDLPIHNKVVSNIPYSISGPIMEKIFFRENAPLGILTIEKALADRIFSKENYKKISRISITVNSFMEPVSKFNISRNCFYPTPKIDMTVVKLKPRKNLNPFLLENESKKFFLKFIAGVMPYKNKSIANALELFFKYKNDYSFKKEEILRILRSNNYENIKVFKLKIEEFINLSKLFYSIKTK